MNKQVELKNKKVIASSHVQLGQKNRMNQTYTDVNDIFYNSELAPNFLTGSEVIREAIKRSSVGTSVAYPITPQSEAAALIGEIYAEGYLDEYFRGESEFAVMGAMCGCCLWRTPGFHHYRWSGYFAGYGKLSHVGGLQTTNSSMCDLPGSQLSSEHSARYFGNVLPA